MITNITFRPYHKNDLQMCIEIFDNNCPEYLDPSELQDYEEFLNGSTQGYEVCEMDGQVIGVFGLSGESKIEQRLNWIMVSSTTQGMGVGKKIMERVIQLGRQTNTQTIGLETSQKVAPFFEKFGAQTLSITKDGFGPGLDRVDMVLAL